MKLWLKMALLDFNLTFGEDSVNSLDLSLEYTVHVSVFETMMSSEEMLKGSITRKYYEKNLYNNMGFTECTERYAQCWICNKILYNGSMFLFNLRCILIQDLS